MKDTRNSQLRPAASLTGALLARRGGARPAMRRQPILMTATANHGDDPGLNDVGDETGGAPSAQPHVLRLPEPMPYVVSNATSADQLHFLAREVKDPADKRSRAKKRLASPADMERKVAFTLRIDAERHLRLRLLSVLSNRSAQRLLTEALDYMVAQSEALNAVMERMESSAATREKKLKL